MKLLLVVPLACCVAALPLGEELLEGSGAIETDVALEIETAASDQVQVQDASDSAQAHSATNGVEIMSQMFENNAGNFNHSFSSSDGTAVETIGEQKQIGDSVGTIMRGSYYYVAPGGEKVKITWIANENGFQAFGDMVPEAPAYVADMLKSTIPVSDSSLAPDVSRLTNGELLLTTPGVVEDAAAAVEDTSVAAEDAPVVSDAASAASGDVPATAENAAPAVGDAPADVGDARAAGEEYPVAAGNGEAV